MGGIFCEKLVSVVRNNFRGSKFRGDSIVYMDDVIRSLRLMVSVRSSSEVSTDFARPQYRVVRETNGRPVLKGSFASLLCQPIFASLIIHGFNPRDSLIEDPVVRGHCQRNTGTCR